MRRVLIGYTGFVGGNLVHQADFDGRFNSRNSAELEGRHCDELVIAAAPAAKWIANREPEQDLATIRHLCDRLASVHADRVCLISTVDVYPDPAGVDENTLVDQDACHLYGRHRLLLEDFVRSRFDTRVIRLPGLFGCGLKKNIIFDYLNGNDTDKVDTRNVFQFYSLEHLWDDIQRMDESGIDLLNLATEPIVTADIARVCTGRDIVNEVLDVPVNYDMRSIHAEAFSGRDGYLYNRAAVLDDLKSFVCAYGETGK